MDKIKCLLFADDTARYLKAMVRNTSRTVSGSSRLQDIRSVYVVSVRTSVYAVSVRGQCTYVSVGGQCTYVSAMPATST